MKQTLKDLLKCAIEPAWITVLIYAVQQPEVHHDTFVEWVCYLMILGRLTMMNSWGAGE